MANRPQRARKGTTAYAVDLENSNSSDSKDDGGIAPKRLKKPAELRRKDESDDDNISPHGEGESEQSSASYAKGEEKSLDAPAAEEDDEPRSDDLVVTARKKIAKTGAVAVSTASPLKPASQRLATPPSKAKALASGSDSDDFEPSKKAPRKGAAKPSTKSSAAISLPPAESPVIDITGNSSRSELLSSPISSPTPLAPSSVAPPLLSAAVTAPVSTKHAKPPAVPKGAKKRTARQVLDATPPYASEVTSAAKPKAEKKEASSSTAALSTPAASAPALVPAPAPSTLSLPLPPAPSPVPTPTQEFIPQGIPAPTPTPAPAIAPQPKAAAAALPPAATVAVAAKPKQQSSVLTGMAGTNGVRRPGLSRHGIKPLHQHKT